MASHIGDSVSFSFLLYPVSAIRSFFCRDIIILKMSLEYRRSDAMSRKLPSDPFSYRDEPYRRNSHRSFSQSIASNNCKRPGHFARDCPNVSICHNCGLPGHIVSECTTKLLCWNCREPGHKVRSLLASVCPL